MKRNLFVTLLLAACLNAQAQVARTPRQRRAVVAATASVNTRAAARPSGPHAPSTASALPIRRVILYSNGVAYVERRGTVAGRAEVNLSFKQSQVDDVLKSLVVLDLGEGRIGAVSYNSSAPPSARMADIPFSIGAASGGGAGGGLAGVLSQLQGARVVVTTARGAATGSVLTVEERREQPDPAKPAVVRHALVIAGEGGELMSFGLDEVRAVKLVEEGTRRDVSEFASATASTRRRDAKTITVTSDGAAGREMLVSYTVAAPIWKTTYRVVLDEQGRPFFQGWAIVDNVGEEDWEQVQLSLISGTPVSFIHPIQKPFYRYRPVVPMPSDLRLSPQVYEPETGEVGGVAGSINGVVTDPSGARVTDADVTVRNAATGQEFEFSTDEQGVFRTTTLPPGNYTVTVSAQGFRGMSYEDVAVSGARPANLNVQLQAGGITETVTVSGGAGSSGGPAPPPSSGGFQVGGASGSENQYLLDGTEARQSRARALGALMTSGQTGVETAAEGGEVGDLFEYQIAQPVTVRRDRSALIPIIQTRMEGERVSIYNEATNPTRPMGGMLLKNTTKLTFEEGALTVIDGNAYAGEALMERLKPGEERLVSFALDLGTLVTTRQEGERMPVHLVRIASGTMHAHFFRREKKTYTLTNQTERERVVYVEHPLRAGWELDRKETPEPEGKSARYHRFRVRLAPRATERLTVAERQETLESYAVTNIGPDQLHFFVANRYIDEPTRAALQNVLDLRARVAGTDARVTAIDREIAEIGADQQRLRQNIEALTKTAEARQLITRYVAKADQQETRIEELTREKQSAVAERQRLYSELDAAVRTLSLDRHP